MMSRSTTSRLLATTTSGLQFTRSFAQTCRRQNTTRGSGGSLLLNLSRAPKPAPRPAESESALDRILGHNLINDTVARSLNRPSDYDPSPRDDASHRGGTREPYHFHIYSHKHNSHITVTRPNREPILSVSAGNIGFRKSKRGSYDAAYQVTAYALDKLNQMGMHHKIDTLEVVLRGFGTGREAATKVLLGNEGRLLRDKIIKTSDATKLKFGGTRSPKPRRLG
ncbi:translational machinery component [Biscogniauxia mediterranea]|nr:translational machinery component [Biscogniauxia mediterranea]